jgi:hypothetical protein
VSFDTVVDVVVSIVVSFETVVVVVVVETKLESDDVVVGSLDGKVVVTVVDVKDCVVDVVDKTHPAVNPTRNRETRNPMSFLMASLL